MKRIYRSRSGKILGVCKGIADYLEVDPTIIRLAAVATFVMNPFIVAFYVIAAFILEVEL